MAKKFRDIAEAVLANASVGIGLGVLEHEMHKTFPGFFEGVGSRDLIYSYWTLLWGGFVALNFHLSRWEKNPRERFIDVAANTALGWTLQDAGYWMDRAGSLDVIGKVDLTWMQRYFPGFGDVCSVDLFGLPLAYVAVLGGYAAYLGRNIVKSERKSKEDVLNGYNS